MLVATVRALKHHGGLEDDPRADSSEALAAVEKGAANLRRHLGIVQTFGLPCVVAVNRRPGDTDEEVELVKSSRSRRARSEPRSTTASRAAARAPPSWREAVADACEQPNDFKLHLRRRRLDRGEDLARSRQKVYGAKDVVFYLDAQRKIRQYHEDGLDKLPICMAKTHLSLSADPTLLNAPEDFELPVRDIRAYTGAGWLVPLAGDIQQMPGLGKARRR